VHLQIEQLTGSRRRTEHEKAEYKRLNHVYSEQRRRVLINEGFDRLERVMPSPTQRRVSKPIMLQRAVLRVRQLQADRHALAEELAQLHSRLQHVQRCQPPLPHARTPAHPRACRLTRAPTSP
jgi:hypothetical protein